jgi:hypothetical protein
MAINYDELEKALAEMQPRQRLFEIVKDEMKKRGHWKYLRRGKPNPQTLNKAASLEIVRNSEGQAVILTGLLPDGTYGIVADEETPFTKEELSDAELFKKHRDDISERMGM